jgi:hypothetical protein
MVMRALGLTALAAALYFVGADAAPAGELLRVEGDFLKWGQPGSGSPKVITYAALSGTYSVPADRRTLSPDNCGAMHSFAEILTESPSISLIAARGELRSAFATWEKAANITFVEVDDVRHANIIVGAADVPKGRAFANLSYRNTQGKTPVSKALGRSGTALAVTSDEAVGKGTFVAIEQAYVCLDPQSRWKVGFDGNLEMYDLRFTFTHEIEIAAQ